METLSTIQANLAIEALAEFDRSDFEKLRQALQDFPYRIRRMGLGQAFASLRANQPAIGAQIEALMLAYLAKLGFVDESIVDIMSWIQNGNAAGYRMASEHCLDFANALKKFSGLPQQENASRKAKRSKPSISESTTSRLPLYKGVEEELNLSPWANGHRGLYHEFFFDLYKRNWTIGSEERLAWLKRICAAPCGDEEELSRSAMRIKKLCQGLSGFSDELAFDWRWLSGNGNPSAAGSTLLWHPTLGVPYLSGTSIKGLLRAWLKVWASEEEKAQMNKWLGTTEYIGSLIFFDALPISPVKLVVDNLGPHASGWYLHGSKIRSLSQANWIAADYIDPLSIPFLAVEGGTLQFAIAPRKRFDAKSVMPALQMLKQALRELGVGAKTGPGYGRVVKTQANSY